MAGIAPNQWDQTLGPGNLAPPMSFADMLAALTGQPLQLGGLASGATADTGLAPVDTSSLTEQVKSPDGMTILGNPDTFGAFAKSMADQSAAGRAEALSYAEAIPMMERLMKGESFFGGLTKGLPLVAALLSGPLGPLLGGALGVSGGVGSALISGGAGALAGGRSGGGPGALLGALGGGLGSLGGSGLAGLLGGGAGGAAGAAGAAGDGAASALGGVGATGAGLGALSSGLSSVLSSLGAGAGGGAGGIADQYGDFSGPTGAVQPGTAQDWADFSRLSGEPGLGGLPVMAGGVPLPGTTVDPLTVTASVRPQPFDPAAIFGDVPGLVNTPDVLDKAGRNIDNTNDKANAKPAQDFLKKVLGDIRRPSGFPGVPQIAGIFGPNPSGPSPSSGGGGGGPPTDSPFTPSGGGGPGNPPSGSPGSVGPAGITIPSLSGGGGGTPATAGSAVTGSPFGGGGAGPAGLGSISLKGSAAPDIYPWSPVV